MSQNQERERAIGIIRKLSKKTFENGCTEDEANLAMDKVGELMNLHSLTMSDVFVDTYECVEQVWESGFKTVQYGTTSVCVAKFCDSLVYVKHYRNPNDVWSSLIGYAFLGLEHDAQLATTLMGIITESYKRCLRDFQQTDDYRNYLGNRRTLTNSFKVGFFNRIESRLCDMTEERAAQFDEIRSQTDEEVRRERGHLKTGKELVTAKMDRAAEAFEERTGRRHRYVRSSGRGFRNADAYSAGRKAGNGVNLSNPVTRRGKSALLGSA